ncbi:uncharacterized protein LOC123691254 [Colias croceus]|uniref:uncharacterized protein LOC123691254 n=1 Tax=Colias crocea TaxID=72248 RepID=UPI001E27F37F|nr:uncharacterized protein LOC123691254 [Colias croceus]
MSRLIGTILISLLITCASSHVAWETPNSLQPVHGLYVMPSDDGTTGDLYVAATEENGSKSQWLTDQPVNFLAAATESQAVPLPLTSGLTTSPLEEKLNTQKRAVLATPPIKYAYALSTTGSEGNTVLPYPYTAPSAAKTEESNLPPCATATQYYSPFQYFYPQMMSAIANAFNAHNKENSASEEGKTSNVPTAVWPHTYAYPFQYVMVDPSAWANQITTAPTPSTTSGNKES